MSGLQHNNAEVLKYWDKESVVSMYDKFLLAEEIRLIKSKLSKGRVLDAGCAEGESTLEYAGIEGIEIDAADFSDTRLNKAKQRLTNCMNIHLYKIDFLGKYEFPTNYDFIISQRFLINLMEWRLQKKVILDFRRMLKNGGKLLMLEGSNDGVKQLNDFRALFNLAPIEVKWHNLFFNDTILEEFLNKIGFRVIQKEGLGEFFLLTRGVRAALKENLNWDSQFNKLSTNSVLKTMLGFNDKFSRLKLWTCERTHDNG